MLNNFFEKLYSIATNNVSINEINDNYNDLLSINLIFKNNDIKGSAGIYFSFPISFLAKFISPLWLMPISAIIKVLLTVSPTIIHKNLLFLIHYTMHFSLS